ncbi:DUF6049 family protein [Microbacterium oleivorans]|uniref:2-oxoglutarate dehydrogenase n=1 Tax=Microbacterium oleivorans TaxID=273677 RepID=A0A7D5ISW4_9MICO|nr:DUF6049 family protein [Microbacterium oleivorans]QLD11937.1 2-oxoglutarate dehydrogenase [Microbacterium oleivorans]
MTVTPTATARARRGRRGARVVAWAAAVVIALVPLMGVDAATADTTPSPTPSPSEVGTASLTAAPTGAGLVPTGSDAVFTVTQRNETSRSLAAGPVTVALSRTPLTSQQAVDDWLRPDDTEADEPGGEEIARTDVPELAAGEERGTSVPVSAADSALADLAPGVYPIVVTGPGGQSRTLITVPRPDQPARSVAVIVPITAGPRTTGIITADELSQLTAEDGALTAALDAVTGTPAVLAVDPAITASIRVLGSSAPASATAWLTTLMGLPNERFALQFGDADLSTQVHAGLPSTLQPTTLEPYADLADFAPAAGSSSPAAVPDTAALTAVGTAATTRRQVFWPASGSAGADVVTTVSAQAAAAAESAAATEPADTPVPDTAPLVLASSDTVTGAPGAPRVTAGGAELLVYDASASTELASAAALDDAAERGTALAASTAKLVLTGDAPVVATVDRPTSTSRAALRAAVNAAYSVPGASPISLAELRGTAGAAATVADVPAAAERVAALERFLSDEDRLATFATALVEPAQLTARERTGILQLLGNAWLDDAAAWSTAVDAHEQATRDTLDAVGIANPGTINFLATSAPISVTVRNDLPWPVSVVLFADTGDPRLIVQDVTPVEAGAQQNTRVDVPVEARVGSGETALQLQLRSAAAVPIGAPETIALTVRAEWESVGVTAIIVIVVVLFAGGVVRTVLKLRRRRSPATAHGDAASQNQENIE